MKNTKCRIITLTVLALFLTTCISTVNVAAEGVGAGNIVPLQNGESGIIYNNAGMTLLVPPEYDELLIVDMPQSGATLFTVSEKLSVEADKLQGGSGDGAGWLFSIGALSEIQLYDMLCFDMSGVEIFARDNTGICYAYYHPTDVRLVRENYGNKDDLAQWTMLNEWAWNEVRDTFIRENEGLARETYGNADLDIYLARTAYADNTKYTLVSPADEPMEPNGVYAAPFVMKLIRNTEVKAIDAAEMPDGDYIAIDFPDDDIRFDFFLAKGSRNIYRQVWSGNEQYFELHFSDGETSAADVMLEWYDALAAADSMRELGYSPDDLIGIWTEKFDSYGQITVEKGAKGTYDVFIKRPKDEGKEDIWEITARPMGEGGVLYYEYGKHTVRIYGSGEVYTEEVQYKNGTGKLYLNSAYEVIWQDDIDHAGDNAVFVNEG